MSQFDAAAIAGLSLHNSSHLDIQRSQTLHRITLLEHWNIPQSARVLELGCGQGDCTTVLASAVGEQGTVVALDPAPLDYGSPYTLGQAQSHISSGPLGSRIRWIQQTPLEYLSTSPQIFDASVLAHSLWYFSSPSTIINTLRALKQHSKRLLIAEWALTASDPAGRPHVLAALAQAALECRKPESESNVRTVLSPKRIVDIATAVGWCLEEEAIIKPDEGLLDGQWEVGACLSASFKEDLMRYVEHERERGVVMALRDACEASLGAIQGGSDGAKAMDVWVASFA